jgi:AcrR family transcriptional regulator
MVTKTRLSSEDRKASIVLAAIQLFGKKGFRGTTTRELAAAVGVSEPVLYEHFATKSELYAAIIERASLEGVALFDDLLKRSRETEDDLAFFTEIALMMLDWHRGPGASFIRLLLFSNLENHEMKDLFFERESKAFFGVMADYIARRMSQGAFRQTDPQLASRAFAGMIAHYCLTAIIFECKGSESHEDTIRGMVSLFLNGLIKQKGAA